MSKLTPDDYRGYRRVRRVALYNSSKAALWITLVCMALFAYEGMKYGHWKHFAITSALAFVLWLFHRNDKRRLL